MRGAEQPEVGEVEGAAFPPDAEGDRAEDAATLRRILAGVADAECGRRADPAR